MSRSKGTKATQGINGDAALLQRWQATATATDVTPCPYEDHRVTDWRLADGGIAVCGVCHPPARGLRTVLVAS